MALAEQDFHHPSPDALRRSEPLTPRRIVDIIKIDDELTNRSEDGFSVEQIPGGFHLEISVIDVSATPVDTTPGSDTLNKISFNENKIQPAVTFTADISKLGEVDNPSFELTYARTVESFTPAQTMEAANGGHRLSEMAQQALDLGYLLYLRRKAGGAITHFDPKKGIITTPEGNKVSLKKGKNPEAQLTVHELMMLFSLSATRFVTERGYPMVYRNQLAPRSFIDRDTTRQTIMMLLEKEELSEEEERLWVKFIKGAFWDVRPMGHYGVGKDYGEFTRPARSFVGQYLNRILVAAIKGDPPPFSQEELESVALRANREDEDTLEDRVSYLRRVARQRARETIETGDFSRILNDDGSINKKRVSRIINVASIEGRFNDRFVGEILRMIEEDRLGSQDLMRLLFIASPFIQNANLIKERILTKMIITPGFSSSVLHAGVDVLFNWSRFEMIESDGSVRASVRVGEEVVVSGDFPSDNRSSGDRARTNLARILSRLQHLSTTEPKF